LPNKDLRAVSEEAIHRLQLILPARGLIRCCGERDMENEEEKEQTKGFKVDDRRRFSAEGELKPEHRGPEQQTESKTSTAAGVAGGTGVGEALSRGQETQATKAASQHREAVPEITFATFVVGLSTEALVHLGELPDPHSEQSAADLPAAQQLIDIIAMLEDKTRGNLDRDEQAMLESILFDLRMKYVERARR
jgi:hypothetical protein